MLYFFIAQIVQVAWPILITLRRQIWSAILLYDDGVSCVKLHNVELEVMFLK